MNYIAFIPCNTKFIKRLIFGKREAIYEIQDLITDDSVFLKVSRWTYAAELMRAAPNTLILLSVRSAGSLNLGHRFDHNTVKLFNNLRPISKKQRLEIAETNPEFVL